MDRECNNCTHWEPTVYGLGKCSIIKQNIEVELVTGWDGGYVDYIETDSEFGCNQHQYLNK
jgi:hypothetical protein